MKKILIVLLVVFIICTGCGKEEKKIVLQDKVWPEEMLDDLFFDYYQEASEVMEKMSLEEKVGQLFLVRYDAWSAKEQIKNYRRNIEQDEIGYVLSVGDGISKVHGLDKCKANELLEFENGSFGMALNLEENLVSAVLLGSDVGIFEGGVVKRTGKVVSVPGGNNY